MLSESNKLKCFGLNDHGQLGQGDSSSFVKPNQTQIRFGVASKAASLTSMCALHSTGKTHCWGENTRGVLGIDSVVTYAEPKLPVATPGDKAIKQISNIGGEHRCAVNSEGELLCWGFNLFGELGTGDKIQRSTLTGLFL